MFDISPERGFFMDFPLIDFPLIDSPLIDFTWINPCCVWDDEKNG